MSNELREAVPQHTLDALDRYIDQRLEPGGFLRAVLREAFGRADMQNREALFDIVNYVYNECPSACWGSPKKVQEWLEGRKASAR